MKIKFIVFFFFIIIVAEAQVVQLKEDMQVRTKMQPLGRTTAVLEGDITITMAQKSKNVYYEKVGEFGDFVYLKKYAQNDDYQTLIVSKFEYNEKFSEATGKWSFGLLSLPIKVRFGGGSEEKNNKRYFDFEGGFNIGLSISYMLNKNYTPDVKWYGVFSIGTSQINLSPETTNNFLSSDQDNIAFSPTLGFVFECKNELQVISIVGWDFLSGEVGTKWVYKDKPFIGIGIGFSAFKFGEKPKKN